MTLKSIEIGNNEKKINQQSKKKTCGVLKSGRSYEC